MTEAPGVEIRRRRIALGITSVSEFAELVGRDRSTVTRAETGTGGVRDDTVDYLLMWLDRAERDGLPATELPDPVVAAVERSGLEPWRRHAVLAEYLRHCDEQGKG